MRLALLLALLWPGISLARIGDSVQTSTLKNGMKILVQEDHTVPAVALYFFYRVGSRDERPGITGISHFFEHMMFNGSQHFGPGEFDRQMEVHGGNNNAYTTKDVTVYTDWFPPDTLDLMMRESLRSVSSNSFGACSQGLFCRGTERPLIIQPPSSRLKTAHKRTHRGSSWVLTLPAQLWRLLLPFFRSTEPRP